MSRVRDTGTRGQADPKGRACKHARTSGFCSNGGAFSGLTCFMFLGIAEGFWEISTKEPIGVH